MPEPEARIGLPPIPAFSRADPHPSGGFIGEDWGWLLRTRAKDLVFAAKPEFPNAGRRPQIACRMTHAHLAQFANYFESSTGCTTNAPVTPRLLLRAPVDRGLRRRPATIESLLIDIVSASCQSNV